MNDEIILTLNSPITEEQWDAINDVDFDHTDRIWFHTKHGKVVEFVKDSSALHESCTDCPLYDHDRHRCPRFNRVIPTAILDAQQRWIPVSERLPEEMGTYMTTIDYGKHGFAVGQRYYYGQKLWEDDCVIAWMPLPEPYKEGDVDEQ